MVVKVEARTHAYDVVIDAGSPEDAAPAVASIARGRAVLVTDDHVGVRWAQPVLDALDDRGVRTRAYSVPPGEPSKSISVWAGLTEQILRDGLDRHTPIVALGGGVVGDLAGFVAATALRGVPFVQIPTTLLAAVDSSVGGKTGVDLSFGKNLIGAFHPPRHVHAGLASLATLPERDLRSGLGEVLKTALLDGPDLFDLVEERAEALRAGDAGALVNIVGRCVRYKAGVVSRDEHERGERANLNLGHTVGHALESALGFDGLLHGEAVALGTIAELAWSTAIGHTQDGDLVDRVRRLVVRLGLPDRAPTFAIDAAIDAMRRDKKAQDGHLVVPVVRRPGDIVRVQVPASELADLLDAVPL